MTGPFDVPQYSKVATPSFERIVSLQVLNNKEKTHTETIESNTSCMCFDTFEDHVCNGDGAGWVSCYCRRWLHDDCVEDYVVIKVE